jgi:hypothetical protein
MEEEEKRKERVSRANVVHNISRSLFKFTTSQVFTLSHSSLSLLDERVADEPPNRLFGLRGEGQYVEPLLLRVTDAVARGQLVGPHQPILDQTSNALLNSSIVHSPLPVAPSRPFLFFSPFLAERERVVCVKNNPSNNKSVLRGGLTFFFLQSQHHAPN